jgi:hypothetical protein
VSAASVVLSSATVSTGTVASEGIGSFDGSVAYVYDNVANKYSLVVSLTNTTTTTNPNYTNLKITGFVFNDNVSGLTLGPLVQNPTTLNFQLLPTSGGTVSASPFGAYEHGAAIGGDWLGGGSPTNGIGSGQTGTFTFTVTGPNLSGLGVTNFLSEGGHGASAAYANEPFVVRFKGQNSDKNGAEIIVDVGGSTPETPLPAAALGGIGLLGGMGVIRRRPR